MAQYHRYFLIHIIFKAKYITIYQCFLLIKPEIYICIIYKWNLMKVWMHPIPSLFPHTHNFNIKSCIETESQNIGKKFKKIKKFFTPSYLLISAIKSLTQTCNIFIQNYVPDRKVNLLITISLN